VEEYEKKIDCIIEDIEDKDFEETNIPNKGEFGNDTNIELNSCFKKAVKKSNNFMIKPNSIAEA
jgi:hypothetical protein